MRWLTLLMALALVASGCGGSDTESATSDETTLEETVAEETAGESTTDESAAEGTDLSGVLTADECIVAYVGWSIWQSFGFDVESGVANKVPDEIKADVDAVARALVKYSAKFDDQFPPEDLGIPPGHTPLDNEQARFWGAIDSLDEEELTPAFRRLEAWAQENCTG
jgi:hypothetical protein